ncbi:PfkB family carbohydrate kinase [Microbacterium trichothecenolyticum]|uniref:Fructokinase n=1 Tax=Microbacterium trichothecenolyticum TaxID=69370 RepID=A0ABU0TVG3_MICTR|nr:PfkB family carbohydrate kinase [Microbacterium trichothecenolyticum]MDQ1123652.1 fructokinase [Microbacterium trichothecenolyticum]
MSPELDVVVLGEALIDIVTTSAGAAERPGGSPANVTVALGRLGRRTALVARVADDERGRVLNDWLSASGVTLHPAGSPEHTATANAMIDAVGNATYEFDIDWVLPVPVEVPAARVFHTGSVAATLAPGADEVRATAERARATALVSYDPNIRPALTGGVDDARQRVEALVALSDVVKASAEDAEWLYPGVPALEVARAWVALGAGLAVITDGDAGSLGVTAHGSVEIPAVPTRVVDTVGAGDTFMGTLLDGILNLPGDVDELRTAVRALDDAALAPLLRRAAAAAAITVGREGMDPPTREDLQHTAALKESA